MLVCVNLACHNATLALFLAVIFPFIKYTNIWEKVGGGGIWSWLKLCQVMICVSVIDNKII